MEVHELLIADGHGECVPEQFPPKAFIPNLGYQSPDICNWFAQYQRDIRHRIGTKSNGWLCSCGHSWSKLYDIEARSLCYVLAYALRSFAHAPADPAKGRQDLHPWSSSIA